MRAIDFVVLSSKAAQEFQGNTDFSWYAFFFKTESIHRLVSASDLDIRQSIGRPHKYSSIKICEFAC